MNNTRRWNKTGQLGIFTLVGALFGLSGACAEDPTVGQGDSATLGRLVETPGEERAQAAWRRARLLDQLLEPVMPSNPATFIDNDPAPQRDPAVLEAGCGTLGDPTFCSATCVCDVGEGDCDGDAQCAPGLHCVDDVGANYGFHPTVDVCEVDPACHTSTNGATDYCSASCQCNAGEGDCDSNADCAEGNVCNQNVGQAYGFHASVDVCEASSSCFTTPVGDAVYCSSGCQCDPGQGDCDSDADCKTGNVCNANVGANYGFDPSVDVCEAIAGCHPSSNGGLAYCSPGCQCDVGEGDCDSNADCTTGNCAADVGANYGWHPSLDVCEAAAS